MNCRLLASVRSSCCIAGVFAVISAWSNARRERAAIRRRRQFANPVLIFGASISENLLDVLIKAGR
jgi:hypothetical protein